MPLQSINPHVSQANVQFAHRENTSRVKRRRKRKSLDLLKAFCFGWKRHIGLLQEPNAPEISVLLEREFLLKRRTHQVDTRCCDRGAQRDPVLTVFVRFSLYSMTVSLSFCVVLVIVVWGW